ncbi:PmoA family protein [Streptomyces sp. JJ36]|uniref:DUF6807 domain-containing protein n=1 Tax=Streptomyces sp. JJ36 TaxID=2736645 RepID=UPI002351BD31|nr:PmoA family protein [Streptomyces sp. JJ36]MCF6523951.1 PmoA family protein [Streptomyces sp. JJ36]
MELRCADRTAAWYRSGDGVPPQLSPRPYLHPVTTPGGVVVTEEYPPDHPHHLGAGMAVADVDHRNFWGGRTFVRDQGPTLLGDHGRQLPTRWPSRAPDGFTEELSWCFEDTEMLREVRRVAVTPLTGTAWALAWSSTLTNPGPGPRSIGSPAVNGRPGAGYGGFFWRAPKEAEPPAVFTASAEGEDAVHGRPAGWLALSGRGWTVVLAGADATTRQDPWFVRAREYPGAGSSLALERRLPVAAGESVRRAFVAVVADGRLDRDAAAGLAARAVRASAHTLADPPPTEGAAT